MDPQLQAIIQQLSQTGRTSPGVATFLTNGSYSALSSRERGELDRLLRGTKWENAPGQLYLDWRAQSQANPDLAGRPDRLQNPPQTPAPTALPATGLGQPAPDPLAGPGMFGQGQVRGAFGGLGGAPNAPAPAPATPFGGVPGYEGPPGIGQGLGGLLAGDPGLTNPPPTMPPANTGYGGTGGNPPAGGGTTVNPPGPGGSVADQGYRSAMGGDPQALDLVLGHVLGALGIDVTRPGLFTGDLVKEVSPYLKTFLRYFGLNGQGAPALDQAKAAADQFGGLLGGPGMFGKLQQYGQDLLPTLGGILGNARGALADPQNQQGIVNDIVGLLTAGDNSIRHQSLQDQLLGANYDYGQEQLGGSSGGYMDFLRRQAMTGKLPGGDLLAQILGATAGR